MEALEKFWSLILELSKQIISQNIKESTFQEKQTNKQKKKGKKIRQKKNPTETFPT